MVKESGSVKQNRLCGQQTRLAIQCLIIPGFLGWEAVVQQIGGRWGSSVGVARLAAVAPEDPPELVSIPVPY